MFKPKSIGKNTMKKQILVFSIMTVFVFSLISQDASASILSASMKNPPQSTADLFTLNNTAGTALYRIDHSGKVFAANNADFHNSTVAFDSSKILVRNPASTFAYTITGGAIVANETLNIPVITGTDTFETLGLAQTISGVKTFTAKIIPTITTGSLDQYALDIGPLSGISMNNNTLVTPFGASSSFSGLFIITDTVSGDTGVFIQGGGVVTLISQTGTVFSTTPSDPNKISVYFSGGTINEKNLSGHTITSNIMSFRTRNSN